MGSGVAHAEPWPHLEFDEFLDSGIAGGIHDYWPIDGWQWLKHSDVVRPDGTSLRRYQRLECAFPDVDLSGMERVFRDAFEIDTPLYPLALLVEDAPGYKIRRHTDCAGKVISAQVYLPSTEGHEDHGVILQTRLGEKAKQIPYRFNHGYAFKVTNFSWHRVKPATVVRRSLQLIYYDTPDPKI